MPERGDLTCMNGKRKEYDFPSFFFLHFLILYKQNRLREDFGAA